MPWIADGQIIITSTSEFGRNRTSHAGLSCPLFGKDRKWSNDGKTDAIDPIRTPGLFQYLNSEYQERTAIRAS